MILPLNAPKHPLVRTVQRLLLVYAAAYVLCFAVEGGMRLKYGVVSVTSIEKAHPHLGDRARAMVARSERTDRIGEDPIYIAYIVVVFLGTPVVIVVLLAHDIKLVNHLMRRVPFPLRWLTIGFVIILGAGVTVIIGPSLAAHKFYDRISPAELLARFPW